MTFGDIVKMSLFTSPPLQCKLPFERSVAPLRQVAFNGSSHQARSRSGRDAEQE